MKTAKRTAVKVTMKGGQVDSIEKLIVSHIKKSGRVGYFHSEPQSACYKAVSYFQKHKPVVNKYYKAEVVIEGYDRSKLFLRRNVRLMLTLIHGMKIECKEGCFIKGHSDYFTEFRFIKK